MFYQIDLQVYLKDKWRESIFVLLHLSTNLTQIYPKHKHGNKCPWGDLTLLTTVAQGTNLNTMFEVIPQ